MKHTPSAIATAKQSLQIVLAIVAALALLFVLIEPQITHSQQFTIQTTVLAESSFTVPPSNITMAGTLNGVTGGQATGSTQFVVKSNNSTGYEVQIAFPSNGTDNAMLGDATGDESLRDYDGDVGGQPSRGYTASSAAQFAYTVTSSTTADTDLSFFHDGTNCNQSGTQTAVCWKSPETSNFTIVDRNTSAKTGATSTILFNITVPNNVTPVPSAETYTATATLSLVNT